MTVKHKDFVRALIFWIAVLLIFLAGSEMLISCKAKKPLVETKTVIIDNKELTKVKNELNRSKAINDSLFVLFGNIKTAKKECDSVCQEAVDRAMENVNNKKTSGGNNFGVYYDKYKKMLTAYANLEETISERKDSIHTEYKAITIEVLKPVLVPAEFSKEQKFNLWVGRLFWVGVLIGIGLRIRKRIPA